MAEPVNPTETPNPGDSQTTVQTSTPTNAGNVVDPAEVERLRKEAEQAKMRANQLEKEAEARKKADEEAEAKRLAEQNEFKDLYEQEKAKREAFENEQRQAEQKAELQAAKDAILKDYSEATVELANDAGLDLSDTSDEAQAKLRSTLDKLQAKVVDKKVTPNNGGDQRTTGQTRQEIIQEYVTNKRESTFDLALQDIPAIQAMKQTNGDA